MNMPMNVAEAIQFVQDVASNEQVRITVRESVRAGVAVGCVTVAAGLLFGPIGIGLGAIVGGIGAAVATRDSFLPLPMVIANMSAAEREQLAARVNRIAADLNVADAAAFGLLLAGNNNVRNQVVQEIVHFIGYEMRVNLAN